MKTWQIFLVGVVGLIALLFLNEYQKFLTAIAALLIIAVVLFGFLARPHRDVFYVQTIVYKLDPDGELCVEHDCIAVRLELARLWLLFAPTFAAVAYFVATSARGSTWQFKVFEAVLEATPSSLTYWLVHLPMPFLVGVIGLLSAWVSERWMLRDAEACSARSISENAARVSYSFVNCSGEYYGGDGFLFRLDYPAELATIVLYNVRKPELNKIAMACVFHRLIIIGRGITDLDEKTVAAHAVPTSLTVQH